MAHIVPRPDMGSDCGDMRSAYTRTKSRDRAQSTREIETVEFQECTTLTIVRDRDAGEICSLALLGDIITLVSSLWLVSICVVGSARARHPEVRSAK